MFAKRKHDITATHAAAQDKVPKDWRERAAQRHQHWSRLHGFKLGRKIGDWAKQDEDEQRDAEAASPRADREQLEREEAQVQAAILESLGQARQGATQEAHGGALSDSGGELQWEEAAEASTSGCGAGAAGASGVLSGALPAEARGSVPAPLPARSEAIASSPSPAEQPAASGGLTAVNDSVASTSAPHVARSAALRLPAMPSQKPIKGSMGPPPPRAASSNLPQPADPMAQRARASQDMRASITALRDSGADDSDFDPDLGRREPPPVRPPRKGTAASLVRHLNDSSAAAMRVAEGSATLGDAEVAASLTRTPPVAGRTGGAQPASGAAAAAGTPSPAKPQSATQLVHTHSPFEDKRTNAAVAHMAAQAEPPGSPPAMPTAPLAVPLPTATSAVHAAAPMRGDATARAPSERPIAPATPAEPQNTPQLVRPPEAPAAPAALSNAAGQEVMDEEDEDEEEGLDLDALISAAPEVLRELPASVQAAVSAHREAAFAQRGVSGLLSSAAVGGAAGGSRGAPHDSAPGARPRGGGAASGAPAAAEEALKRKGGAVVKAADSFLAQAAQRHRTEGVLWRLLV